MARKTTSTPPALCLCGVFPARRGRRVRISRSLVFLRQPRSKAKTCIQTKTKQRTRDGRGAYLTRLSTPSMFPRRSSIAFCRRPSTTYTTEEKASAFPLETVREYKHALFEKTTK